MGNLVDYAVPGSFFYLFGLWWMYNIFNRYFYSRKVSHVGYKNVSNFPLPKYTGIPIESIMKIVLVTVGIIGEFVVPMYGVGEFYWDNILHMTMYFFFGLNGLVELAIHRGWEVLPNLDYVTAALGFGVEGFLFCNPLHERPPMDIMVHMYLLYLIVACIVSTLAEMYQPENVAPAVCRAFFTLLQGTWFWQIGYILHPRCGQWNLNDPHEMMIVTVVFTWHVAFIIFVTAVLGTLVWLKVNKVDGPFLVNPNPNIKKIIKKKSNDNDNTGNGDTTIEVSAS